MRRSYIQSEKVRSGADCGSDHEHLFAKFRIKMKKVGIATRLFRCDLNQILHDYTVEVRIRFKGLYIVDIVPEELWSEVSNTVEEAVNKNIPKKNKCEKAKGLSEESLKIAEERSERQGRKGKIHPTEYRVSENSRER